MGKQGRKNLLSEADIDPNSKRASAFKGRAEMPKLAKKRLEANPIPAKDLLVAAGYGYKARAFATLKEALTKMQSYAPPTGQAAQPLREGGKRSRNWHRFADLAVGMFSSDRHDLNAAWSNLQPESLTEAQGAISKCVTASPADRRSAASEGRKTLERLERKPEEADKAESDRTWWQWVAEALNDGASKAHGFIKKHEAPVVCDSSGKPPQPVGPIDKAEADAKGWGEKWQSSNADGIEEALGELSSYRAEALSAEKLQGGFPKRSPA